MHDYGEPTFRNKRLPCCGRRPSVKKRNLGDQVTAACECGGIPKKYKGTVERSAGGLFYEVNWERVNVRTKSKH